MYNLPDFMQSVPNIPFIHVMPGSQHPPVPEIQIFLSPSKHIVPIPWKKWLVLWHSFSVVSLHPPRPSQQAPIVLIELSQEKYLHEG